MGGGKSKAFGGGGAATMMNPEVEKTLNQIIKRTANLKKEQYRIIDENGNVVLQKQGVNDSVATTVGEKRQYLDGATSIHNHPNDELGGTFSPNDLSDFGYGAKEIVVATPEGTYRLKNTKWGTKEQQSGWLPMRSELEKIADNQSALKDLQTARARLANSREAKRMKQVSDEWVTKKKAGASESALKPLMDEYSSLEAVYKKKLNLERRKVELEPYHEFYKKNAKKYGFAYSYPKGV